MEVKESEQKRNTKMFLPLLFAAILLASIVPMACADPGWNWRRPINITNSGGSVLTDYQVLVTLNTSNFNYSKANLDGSDLRFTNYANSTAYRYWIETWSTSGESKIWVKVPSIPVWDGTGEVPSANRMYMWYNNSAASSESNGTNTFDFFDDFEGTSLDTTKWTSNYPDQFSVSGGKVRCTGVSWYPQLTTKTFTANPYSGIEVTSKLDVIQLGSNLFCGYGTYFTSPYDGLLWYGGSGSYDRHVCFNGACGWQPGTDRGLTTGEIRESVRFLSNSISHYTTGARTIDDTFSGTVANANRPLYIFNTYSGYITDLYWVFVRKYADPEPTTTVSDTEEDVTGPVEPVPELPTIILFSIGLLVLTGYVVLRRKR